MSQPRGLAALEELTARLRVVADELPRGELGVHQPFVTDAIARLERELMFIRRELEKAAREAGA